MKKPRITEMSNDFTSRLVEAYKIHLENRLTSIVLFGSRARGDYKVGEDYRRIVQEISKIVK